MKKKINFHFIGISSFQIQFLLILRYIVCHLLCVYIICILSVKTGKLHNGALKTRITSSEIKCKSFINVVGVVLDNFVRASIVTFVLS